MRGVNKVLLVGNVGQKPELRYSSSGQAMLNLSLATNRRRSGGEEGQANTEVEWHRLTMWGRDAELGAQLIDKGTPLYIDGRLVPRKWTDKEGNVRHSVDVWVESFKLLGRVNGAARMPDVVVEDTSADEIPF